MKKHTELYLDFFDIPTYSDVFIPSELSGKASQAIHHIQRRGMGGDGTLDRIENLMALTDHEHHFFGDIQRFKSHLYTKHLYKLEQTGKEFDRQWITSQIYKYSPYESMNLPTF